MSSSAAAQQAPPMAPESSPAPPRTDQPELIAGLQQDLAEAGFTNAGVAQLLGSEAVAALDREQVVPGQLRILDLLDDAQPTGAADPHRACAVLTGLWLVAVEVSADLVDAALPRTGTAGLAQLGLAEMRTGPRGQTAGAGVVVPTADLRPYQVQGQRTAADLWVTSDLSAHQVDGALPHDHVLGVGQASLTLAGSTHRRPAAAALDIGTGCGIQLLHLLAHCDHVTGTDVSARALSFARFNLLLNAAPLGLDPYRLEQRVELRQGSLLEPVAGRRFDLVVSNPPFVITPRTPDEARGEEQQAAAQRYTYRDAGRAGDELMAELITGLGAVLNPGGTAQMLGNWELHAAPHWADRPRRWAEQSGLHAWFIQREQQTPAEYAETWLRDASQDRSIAAYRDGYAEYLADFAARGVVQIGFGLIWLQRPGDDGEPDHRFEEVLGEVQQPLGPAMGQGAARGLQDPADVLKQLLVVPDTVTEERYQRFGDEHPEVIIARQGTGLRRARPISSAAAGFLAAADGEYTAAQLITAVCSLIDADEAALSQEVCSLYVQGYLDSARDDQSGQSD